MGVLGQSRDKGSAAVAPNVTGPVDRTGFFENVGAGFKQAVAGPHSTKVGEAIYQTRSYDQIIKALQAEGEQGEDTLNITTTPTQVKRPYRNPYVSGPAANLLNPSYNPITSLYGGGDRKEIDQIWAGVQRVRQRKPDFLKAFPNEGALAAWTVAQRQKDQAAAQSVSERASTSGSVGSFVGGMGGSIASMDPENTVGGLGGAAGKTFARTVIKRAVEGAGANTAAAIAAVPGQVVDAQHLGQEMTAADIAHQVEQSAAIGAAFGTVHAVAPVLAGKVGSGVKAVAGKVAAIPPVQNALVAASIRAGTVQDRGLLNEWARTHNPGGRIDTTSPDERAAAHVMVRDADNREVSPLHPDAAVHNENRLQAVADSLGVTLTAPEMPSSAPIQHATVRTATGRRPATYDEGLHSAEGTTRNPKSTADGHFQFTEGTWLEYAPRVTDTKGKSRAEILAMRHDRPVAEKAEQLFRADNGRYLRSHGIEDSPGNLSLAHFLGKGDAAKVLQADPATPIERLVDPASLAANRKVLAGKSASEVVAWAHKRIGATVDMPVARADAVGEADPLDPEDFSDVPYERAIFKPDQIETDAGLMQYKSGGDEAGVTGALTAENAWNPIKAGEVLVWEGNDGRRVLVDGHQRLDLAKRTGTEEIPAVVLRGADGITAEEARAVGAARNISLATGGVEDGSRVLADLPETADLLKPAPHRTDIEGLAALPYEDFGAVLNGEVDPQVAARRYTYSREISPELDRAQRAYIDKTKQRISQTELQRLSWALQDGMTPEAAAAHVHEFFSRPIDWEAERKAFAAELKARKGKPNAEPALQPVTGAANEGRALGEPSGETGGRDAAAASDILLSERDEPSLFAHAVAARDLAEPFSDPVGAAAKSQTEVLDHDLRMDAAVLHGEVVEAPKPGELWKLPEEELQALADEKRLGDHEKLVKAFGSEERAKRFEALDRMRNSSDPRRSDEGSGLFDREFGDLTPDQERLAYGIGETDAQESDIRDILKAYSDVIPSDDANWAAYMAAHSAARVRPEELAKVPLGTGSVQAQVAYVRIGRAYQVMAGRGVPTEEIPRRMAEALVERGHWTPEQAAEIIGGFTREMAAMAENRADRRPANVAQLPAPQRAMAPPPLFDLPETGHRLSEEGDAKPLADIMREAEDDELAAKALRDCLMGGGIEPA